MTFESEGDWIAPSAAMALIRMDELMQSHVPLYRQLIRVLLSVQQADGSWGDPAATALCLRALLSGKGDGIAAAALKPKPADQQERVFLAPEETNRGNNPKEEKG